ncbi:immunity protein Imm33 domain-containing protein [Paenibacillus radicis (ex Xue et al. 2023)]|uniref:immunity protein Imm33 domain-containing protein n=1 Tax=Paenibacillus radicis (ex Xue et al. 2023) TaxID=2972489 RepID=UPI003AF31C99
MFEGTVPEEYNNDPSNTKIIDVYYLCEKDHTLISIFKNDYGSAFEREDRNSPWIEIKDWHFD